MSLQDIESQSATNLIIFSENAKFSNHDTIIKYAGGKLVLPPAALE